MKTINSHLLVQADSVRIPLPDGCVQVVCTSPPYWGLRSYLDSNNKLKRMELGLEESPDCGRRGTGACGRCYVCHMVVVFREVRRVLRDDGCVWVNLGDSFASSGSGPQGDSPAARPKNRVQRENDKRRSTLASGFKAKDLCGIPWRVALALQADGWWLRGGPPWVKLNAMCESVLDRPSTAHEHIFLLTKSGSPTFWTHRDGKGSRTRPAPDYRWVDRLDGGETAEEPEGWRTEMMPGVDGDGEDDNREKGKEKRWTRVNLWDARDYYYDNEAVRVPSSGNSGYAKQRAKGVANWSKTTQAADGRASRGVVTGNEGSNRLWVDPGSRNRRTSDWFLESLDERIAEQRAYLQHLESVRCKGGMLVDEGGDPLAVVLSTEAFKGSHFATMPRRLVEPCLKASTSQAGACGKCGAAWARVTERTSVVPQDYGGKHLGSDKQASGRRMLANVRARREAGQDHDNPFPAPTTVGWAPTCSCPEAANLRPCLALDPFNGAGTVLVVAEALGLRAIGLDLSREYLNLSKRRLERPHARIAAPVAKDKPMPLLDLLGDPTDA